ncbi:hypothetical protein PUN28_008546 [Cardiocondyla obscurior]|uniref:Uncharacterized protein n=1 Tax=Cardiocondyla obscurior TaxID=286306 RepID=A0AAW2G4E7_9HYME
MFRQVFQRVQVVTADRLLHVLAGSGNALWERRKPQVVSREDLSPFRKLWVHEVISWLCANPCFTWRCIITIIVRFTVLQFFGRRGWETDGQPRFPRPGLERQKAPRRERKPAISASKGADVLFYAVPVPAYEEPLRGPRVPG